MTAPTIALTQAEAEAVARANAALSWIGADTFPWPARGSGDIRLHADVLRDSLRDYADLTASRIHPATLFPDLDRHQDDAQRFAEFVTREIDPAYVTAARSPLDELYAAVEELHRRDQVTGDGAQ